MNVRAPIVQVLLVAGMIAGITFLVGHFNFRGAWNAAWMVGLPVGIGLAFNRGAPTRILMSFMLLMCSFASMMLTAGIFGIGP